MPFVPPSEYSSEPTGKRSRLDGSDPMGGSTQATITSRAELAVAARQVLGDVDRVAELERLVQVHDRRSPGPDLGAVHVDLDERAGSAVGDDDLRVARLDRPDHRRR